LYPIADFVYFCGMNPEELRREFLDRVVNLECIIRLLDLLPDVAFFVKDRQSRFIVQNRRACEYCHAASDGETVGKTDYDFYPRDRAQAYVDGDIQVMTSGIPIINAVAPAPEVEGSDRLIFYSKVPVYDRSGAIIGVAGIHREIDDKHAVPRDFGPLARAVHYMHAHHAQPLGTRQLAGLVGMSHSQFERRFRRLFGASPRQYLLRVRVNAACRLLAETRQSVTDIALETGFYDHSHFSRTFSRLMGVSPLLYRKRHETAKAC
jgi:AraC-like DNA-binding protein